MIQKLIAVFAFMKAMLGKANKRAGEELLKTIDAAEVQHMGARTRLFATKMGADTRGQLGLPTVLAAFTVAIAAMVVIIVLDQINNSLDDPSSSDLNNSSDSVLSGFADMAALIGPLFLIAIGVVIIGLIRRVQ